MKRWSSVLGQFDVTVGDLGVVRVAAPELDSAAPPALDADLAASFDAHIQGHNTSLRLDLHGASPLKQVTLAKLLEIPFGEVRSYGWVAREIGRPSAVRAVASAIAKNPLPLLIPCHRVVRSDGKLGEYSLVGPELKQQILALEGLDIVGLNALTARGIRFLGDAKEQTFHERTCRLALPSDDEMYVELRSAQAAEALLFKACRRCRPIHVY